MIAPEVWDFIKKVHAAAGDVSLTGRLAWPPPLTRA